MKVDHRNYRQFVSFIVGEILEQTGSSDGQWVPSKSNLADEATKWKSGSYFVQKCKWLSGPIFLMLPEEKWALKLVQREPYSDEVAALSNQATIEIGQMAIGRYSAVYQLVPMLDESDLL